MIRGSSDFFNKALGNEWKEATERVVKLPEDKLDIFRLYMHWLYCDTIPTKTTKPKLDNEHKRLAKAYILGDKVQDLGFCDAIMDAIIHKMYSAGGGKGHAHPNINTIVYVYKRTLPSSKLRQVYAALHAYHADETWHNKWAKRDELPKDFLLDMAMLYVDKSANMNPLNLFESTCKYHQHGSEPCYKDAVPKEALEKGVKLIPWDVLNVKLLPLYDVLIN